MGSEFEIKEGDDLDLTCEAQAANPSVDTYIWRKESDTFTGNSNLHVENIKAGDDGAKFTCTATNTMTRADGGDQPGTGTRTVTLSVIRKHQRATSSS